MGKYLIESALLGQGLPGLTEEELESLWPENPDGEIAWMKAGTLITGGISKFVRFRKETENCARICYQNFETAAEQKRTGFLTASGTMKACEKLQVPFAVSCGIGGLKTQQTIESKKKGFMCPDVETMYAMDICFCRIRWKYHLI